MCMTFMCGEGKGEQRALVQSQEPLWKRWFLDMALKDGVGLERWRRGWTHPNKGPEAEV